MKILYLAQDLAPYADRSHEIRVAEQLAIAGHEVGLVAERVPKWTPTSPKPENLHFLGQRPLNDPSQTDRIARLLPNDYDVVFASSASGAPAAAAYAKLNGRRAVAQALDIPIFRLALGDQGPWKQQWRPWFDGLMSCDHVIVNTKQTAQDLLTAATLYGAPNVPPSSVVYYGIDVETADAATPLDREPSEGRAYAVGISRLVPYKGFDLAISALSLLAPQSRPLYHIIGTGEDMLRLVHHSGFAGVDVAFHGGLSDVNKFSLIKACDFGINLQTNPNIPLQAPMECAYAGKPSLVHDSPINRERCLGYGVTYVNAHDTRAVAAATHQLATDAPHVSQAQKEAWQAWIRDNRSFHSHARGTLRVLEGVA